MPKKLYAKEKDVVRQKGNLVASIIQELNLKKIERYFYHYSSIEVLFNILESDSFWVSNTRFSNDDSEEKMLEEKGFGVGDNYIACFCDNGDQLSQWRGYCPTGGASIEFDLNAIQKYSVLHADYDTSGKYELKYNTPIPVIYTNNSENKLGEMLDAIISINANKKREVEESNEEYRVEVKDIMPFLKNDKFAEERESRLTFANNGGELSSCIRFRTLKNKAKIPYMVVKMGDVGLLSRGCKFDKVDEAFLESLIKECPGENLWIPEGNDQEALFEEINATVKKFNSRFIDKESHIKVFCSGHLPIKKIIISPTYDRERISEQVKRFCQSKYWLRNVEVVPSEIPYVSPYA